MKNQKKLTIILSIALAIFAFGIVDKEFENDTFFNISIGKYILNNGIDMLEHFSWVPGLTYTYSHWAFDILIYLLYNTFNFEGIYYFTVFLSIVITLTLFTLLNKKYHSPALAAIVTIISVQLVRHNFVARSQIISFLCFIIEIYCIEQFIDTNKKKYAIALIVLAIIVANFHSPTWIFFAVLFMPYIACGILNFFSFKNIYTRRINKIENKLKTLQEDSKEYSKYIKSKEETEILLEEHINFTPYSRITKKENYNFKNLVILLIIILFTGFLTPTHGTPYTYVINSMFGNSHFENGALSINYILEMQPSIPISNIAFLAYTIFFISFTMFMPAKLKLEHGFLILGLYIMALSSRRYTVLLILLGSYVTCDLFVRNAQELIPEDIETFEKYLTTKIPITIIMILISCFTISSILQNRNIDFINEELYPVGATKYIKENLDYKNIKIFNHYNYGSYLMLNDIPVFIDSRLDVYCSEFNPNSDVFKDFTETIYGKVHYEDIFSKYGCTHILLNNNNNIIIYTFISKDNRYHELYRDDYFVLYEKVY